MGTVPGYPAAAPERDRHRKRGSSSAMRQFGGPGPAPAPAAPRVGRGFSSRPVASQQFTYLYAQVRARQHTVYIRGFRKALGDQVRPFRIREPRGTACGQDALPPAWRQALGPGRQACITIINVWSAVKPSKVSPMHAGSLQWSPPPETLALFSFFSSTISTYFDQQLEILNKSSLQN